MRPSLRSATALSRRWLAPLALVLLVVLSSSAFGHAARSTSMGDRASFSAGATLDSVSSGAVHQAAVSLSHGASPAAGVSLSCSTSSSHGASCAARPAGLTSSVGAGWANVTASSSKIPAPRSYGRDLAYDPVDKYVVLFGGYGSGGGYLDDTWTYKAGVWTQLHPTVSPPARDHSTFIWDPVDGYMLMFAGSGNGGDYNDTWTFLNGTWHQLHPAHAPSARWSASMVWDTADGYALLFGGCAGYMVGDTWSFAKGNWTNLTPAYSPEPRSDASMSYDPHDGYVVLFGGWTTDAHNDTWTWSAGQWTQLQPRVYPSERSEASIAYDPALSSVVLFGGGYDTMLSDTWLYSAGIWTQVFPPTSPGARQFGIMAYDGADNYLVLFSGSGSVLYDDTWIYYTENLTSGATSVRGDVPFTTTFEATTIGGFAPYAYTWNFGDASNLGNGNVTNHTYSQSGFYVVTSTVSDAYGVSTSTQFGVTVLVRLALSAYAAPLNGTVPLVVQFGGVAAGGNPPYQWSWSFGATSTGVSSHEQYTFRNPGSFPVHVIVNDSSQASVEQNFTVFANPVPIPPLEGVASGNPTSGEAPVTATLNATAWGGIPPYSYVWVFGDGGRAAGQNQSYTYTSPGTFLAVVSVTDLTGTTIQRTVNVTVLAPVAVSASWAHAPGGGTTRYLFAATASAGLGPYETFWTFGDQSSAVGAKVAHNFTIPGTYTVGVQTVDALGRTASTTLSVNVASVPFTTNTTTPASTSSSSTSMTFGVVGFAAGIAVGGAVIGGIATLIARRRG